MKLSNLLEREIDALPEVRGIVLLRLAPYLDGIDTA